jgi:Spy/CpxP family protein refolding chaperone
MSKRKAIITAVVAIIALAAVPFVYAQTAGRHHHAGSLMFAHFNRIRAALGLTDDQVTQLKAIREDLRTQNAPYRDQMRGGFAAVAQTLLKDPGNVAGAQLLIDQQSAARKAMQVNVLNATSKALKVLTPEQRAKASELLQQRMAMQGQRMQHDH